MIDLERIEEYPSAAIGERLLAWTAPARAQLGIDPALPGENGSQRQRRQLADGATMQEVFAAEVETAGRTYANPEVRA